MLVKSCTEPQVLVIDGQPETAEVLQAVLEPRGVKVHRVRWDALCNSRDLSPAPKVIVLHGEPPSAPAESANAGKSANEPASVPWGDVPRIFIGSSRFQKAAAAGEDDVDAACEYLSRPFHYHELVAAIDRLLDLQFSINWPWG